MKNLIALVRHEGFVAGMGWIAFHLGVARPSHDGHRPNFSYGWETANFETSEWME